ncbi:MAG TPA: hypothetical protein VLV78_05420 [Thermoanaerobaculia bacterium]|nr:hypothetical protein [Thermoanaerobaculia bacterium]
MRRLTAVAVFLLVLTGAFSYLLRFYSRRLENFTGRAQWIWASVQISRNEPVVFFAARDFDLPETRQFAHLKIFADPEYALYLNGRQIAARRAEGTAHLDLYDVSPLVRTGRNRIVVAVHSTNGVGGLIAGLDIANEVENWVVTDRSWRIFRAWNDVLPLRDAGPFRPPMLLGTPPVGRWDYLVPKEATFDPAVQHVVEAKQAIEYRARIPTVRIVEGVAVATERAVRATAFDFGFTSGRVRFSLIGDNPVPPVIQYRLANVREEFNVVESRIRSTAFGAGERSVTDPEQHRFRYVIVFGGRARVEVLQ